MILPVFPMKDLEDALDYYTRTLGFQELMRIPGPNGEIVNARVERGGVQLMFNLNPEMADQAGGGVWFWLYMDGLDIDAYYAEMTEKGLNIVEPIQDQFWGDRSFTMQDKFGYYLVIAKETDAAQKQSYDHS